jgi:hypothetical protein
VLEHAQQSRTTAEPTPAQTARAAASAEPAAASLDRRSEAKLAGPAQLLRRHAEAAAVASPAAPVREPGPRPVQPPPNRTGLPDRLKAGVEALSGRSMEDVRVHRNSSEPAKLGALAYAKGSAIHLAPGQERHLPHEAWHVAQQRQGRVKATAQLKGEVGINDDAALEHEADVMGARALGEQRPIIAAAAAPTTAVQRKPIVQRTEQDAITIAAGLAAAYGIHLNTMTEVTEEKYLFTADEWQQIVTAYNAGGGAVRLRYSYDPAQYVGNVEQQIIDDGNGATTLDGVRALAERYAVDVQARPGFYGRKVARTAAGVMVGVAVTMVAGPVVGAMASASTGVALNFEALKDQAKLAQQQYRSGDYHNALVTLGQLGLSFGSSAASATGHGHVAHVETAVNLVSGSAKKKLKTE